MGKVIKFPGKHRRWMYRRRRPVHANEHRLPEPSSGELSFPLKVLSWIFMGLLGIILAILFFVFRILFVVFLIGTIVSFVAMIVMWNEPTYTPMLVFLGSLLILSIFVSLVASIDSHAGKD